MRSITAIAAKHFPHRFGWSDSRNRFVFITKTGDRRNRIYNIRECVHDAVKYGLWSKEMYEDYIAAHPLPVRRRPDSGRDVLSDFEIAYWNHSGSPAPADLI